LEAQPGRLLSEPGRPGRLYAKDPAGLYRRLQLPGDSIVGRAKITLLAVLAVVYCLAVLVLELWLLRTYIHRPLRALLDADEASRRGDTQRELIDPAFIPSDELGRLMSSRNSTVRQLRQHEQDLRCALRELQEVAQDLIEKNRLLETAKDNLAAQDRLASLGLLSASVAHEMNTPLAVLRGSLEKLLESDEPPQARERLERMLRVARRLQTISESLLDFSREREQSIESVSIRPLIEDAWGLVAIDEKAAGVHFTNETGSPHAILGNAHRLEQLFVNLLRNALYAVGPSGDIQVRSEQQTLDGRDWLVIAVEDSGAGIPPGVLPRVFEAFVTTRLDARGTGLGLTVAEGIAHQHGGGITASNRPEGGARLEVRLPAGLEQPVAGAPAAGAALPPREGMA
jgi:two-component system NtrC family sensor kinase